MTPVLTIEPQSKRKSTRLQEGIKKKVAAHNRKQRKNEKKNITWKSKNPKDPGIPSSFPYKAQILEQIEENRRKELEERERRREEQRQRALAAGKSAEEVEKELEIEESHDNSNRLAALLESAQQAAQEYEGAEDDDDDDMMDDSEDGEAEEEIVEIDQSDLRIDGKDTSRKVFDKIYKTVVDSSDVVLYVLDSRNPEGTRSRQVEHAVLANPNKRLIFVLNKIDLVPHDVLRKWNDHLSLSFPTIPLAASSPAPNAQTFEHKGMTRTTTANHLLQSLKKFAGASQLKRAITVGVVGYPNVGKSSVINALTARHGASGKACPVGAQAGVTTSIRKVKVDNKLNILDSPGIVFPSSEKKRSPAEEQARLILLNALPPKQIEDPRPAVSLLLKRLGKSQEQTDRLWKYYDVPSIVTIPHDDYVTQFLIHVARKMGRLGKSGVPDLNSAAMAVINDWRDGRVAGWAAPPAAPTTKETGAATQAVIVTEWAQEFSLDGLWEQGDDEQMDD